MGNLRPKILVIRGGAIGDFILTLPVLSALRRQFPDAHLEVLGYTHIVQLAIAGGLADTVRSIEAGSLAGFFARNGNLDATLQKYFSEFALIISYLFDPDKIFQTNMARCTKAQFIVGPHRPKEQDGIHATKVFLQPLERLAIFDADTTPRLPKSLRVRDQGRARRLALHPGSGSEHKNWPEENWSELLRELVPSTKLNFLLVGGEAEGERIERLTASLPCASIQLARSLTLTELAKRLETCVAFVGHDSGISHLAAAIGLPALMLWGESAEAVWRPQGPRVAIIRNASGLAKLPVQRVAAALKEIIR